MYSHVLNTAAHHHIIPLLSVHLWLCLNLVVDFNKALQNSLGLKEDLGEAVTTRNVQEECVELSRDNPHLESHEWLRPVCLRQP